MIGIVILVLFVIVFTICISKYNKMVRYKNKVKESLRLVDIHLQLRFDLIPNLVETVKGYCKHEEGIFSKLIEVRKKAVESSDEKDKLSLANELVPLMKQVLVISEDYPELKSNSLYRNLMEELILVEDKLAASRRFYDSNVNEYNTLIGIFPNNIIASICNFKEMELFKIDVGENFSSKINMEK